MPKRITQEEFQKRVDINSHNMYEVLTPYQGRYNKVTLKCKKHLCEFTLTADAVTRREAISCPDCKEEETQKQQVKLQCAYCGKEFYRKQSKVQSSKSGKYFCTREHKDLAQTLNFGLTEIHPDHYGSANGIYSYRKIAFYNYPHECAVCGYNEEVGILEVHHKDGNRNNNKKENLTILCPNCHRKITLKLYCLKDNFELEKMGR